MKDVIELLLQKQSSLEADKEADKALAIERIESEYAERAGKLSTMLDLAGYEPPVLDDTDDIIETVETDEQAFEQADEQAHGESVV